MTTETLPASSAGGLQFCEICDKPFTSAPAFKRHAAYCRRRAETQPRKRQRSCRHCNAAKTKCSFRNPCSRCESKGLGCDFGVSTAAAVRGSAETAAAAAAACGSRSGVVENAVGQQEISASDDATGVPRLPSPSPMFHEIDLSGLEDPATWDLLTSNLGPIGDITPNLEQRPQGEELDPESLMHDESGAYGMPLPPPLPPAAAATTTTPGTTDLVRHPSPPPPTDAVDPMMLLLDCTTDWAAAVAASNRNNSNGLGLGRARSPPLRIPEVHVVPMLAEDGALRVEELRANYHFLLLKNQFPPRWAGYVPRPLNPSLPRPRPVELLRHDPAARQSSRLLVEALRAYPAMMTRRNTFPPFIHAHWHRGPAGLPGALANCLAICKMFAALPRGGGDNSAAAAAQRTYLRECVAAEQRRFLAGIATARKEDLLAQLQAIMIYVIMQVVDDEDDDDNGEQQQQRSGPAVIPVEALSTYQQVCARCIGLIMHEEAQRLGSASASGAGCPSSTWDNSNSNSSNNNNNIDDLAATAAEAPPTWPPVEPHEQVTRRWNPRAVPMILDPYLYPSSTSDPSSQYMAQQQRAWERWVFNESRRRVACLWFLISRVVDIRDGVWCPELCACQHIPLPGPRSMWEARTLEEWDEARREEMGDGGAAGGGGGQRENGRPSGGVSGEAAKRPAVSTFGELREARMAVAGVAGASAVTRELRARLAGWNAGIDGLGYLVNLATTMV